MGCAGSARLQNASASASLHRTPTPVKREIEVQTIPNIVPIYVETEVDLEKHDRRHLEDTFNTQIDIKDTGESLDKPELPIKSDTDDNESKIEVKEEDFQTTKSTKENSHLPSTVQLETNQYDDDKSNNVEIHSEDKDNCTLHTNSNTVNSQELSGGEDVDSRNESPDANEVVRQVRHWLNSTPQQQDTSSPKRSCRETRWEALADVVSELPPRLAVDSVTGQIYTYVSSHPASRRPPPPPLPPS